MDLGLRLCIRKPKLLLEQDYLEHEERIICRSSSIEGIESCKFFTNWSPIDDVVDLAEQMGGVGTALDLKLFRGFEQSWVTEAMTALWLSLTDK